MSYAYDTQWRVVGPAIRSGSTIAATQVTPYWAPNGDLDSLVHKVGSTARGKYAKRGTDGDSPGLISTWVDPNSQTWQDSVVYDAWERAAVHVLMEGGVAVTRDSLWFDRNGNVRTSATAGVNETYDLVTNRLTSQVVGGVTWTLKYDRAGNLILRKAGSDSTRYFYDGLNRLRTVRRGAPSHADSVIARYDYDVAGRRIVKRVYSAGTGGAVGYTRFVYRGSAVSFETDSGGTLGQRYLWGMGTDALLALRTASGSEYYAVLDKLGSVRGMVLRDASGTVKLAFTYGTYGAIVDSVGAGLAAGVALRYRWTGREFDPETGFYFLRARYYDPAEKRFVQEDPAGLSASPNLYAYANSSPLEATDPSGLMTNYKAMADQANSLAAYNSGLSDVSAGEWWLYDSVMSLENDINQIDQDFSWDDDRWIRMHLRTRGEKNGRLDDGQKAIADQAVMNCAANVECRMWIEGLETNENGFRYTVVVTDRAISDVPFCEGNSGGCVTDDGYYARALYLNPTEFGGHSSSQVIAHEACHELCGGGRGGYTNYWDEDKPRLIEQFVREAESWSVLANYAMWGVH